MELFCTATCYRKKGLGCRAKCKDCGTEMQGLVSRMKDHMTKCVGQEQAAASAGDVAMTNIASSSSSNTVAVSSTGSQQPHLDLAAAGPSTSSASAVAISKEELGLQPLPQPKLRKLDSYVTKTTKSEKEALDEQIAKFVYATNSSFRIVEHAEFIRMVQLLRPGYIPPNRIDIGGKLLDAVHKKCVQSSKEMLEGKTVCMSLDGWSNVHSDPVICATVTTQNSEIFLADTIDTSGHSHTADYLVSVAVNAIETCEKQFGCSVRSCVTDNAANVAKMREELEKREDIDVITYGCSAHLMNLLAKDLEIPNIK